MSFATSPGKIASALICQNPTSLCRKLSVAYVCRIARRAAGTQAKIGAKWKDFGKLLVKKAHSKRVGETKLYKEVLYILQCGVNESPAISAKRCGALPSMSIIYS